MTTSPDSQSEKQEHPSTYVVQDRSNQEELLRLDGQDRLFTMAMGGVLVEQPDPTSFQRVLDVGCGPGWWLIQTAKVYPTIEEFVGVDISLSMVEYARAQAEAAQVSDRVHFQTGDALRMLEFRTDYFTLINQRFGFSYLRTWDWPKLLQEYQRVCRPGGVIRITESGIPQSNSPALTRLLAFSQQAFYQSGHFFTNQADGIIAHVPQLMERYGIADIQTKRYDFAFHSDPQALQGIIHDFHRGFRTLAPFFRKWTKIPADYDTLYEQMVQETQQPDIEISVSLLTAWGTKKVQDQ